MSNSLYETDFHDWLAEQAVLLRTGEFASLDIGNLVEELEALGRSERNDLESRIEVLLTHLLKWQVQAGHRSASWSATIREQRSRIEARVADSPSLRPRLEALMHRAYPRALLKAQAETGLEVSNAIRNPSTGDTENPSTSATVMPRLMPVRVSP